MKKTALLLMLTVLTACTYPVQEHVERQVGLVDTEATALHDQTRNGNGAVVSTQQGMVQRVDTPWLPVSRVNPAQDPNVEAQLKRSVAVNRRFENLDEMMSYVTSLTGVPLTSRMVTQTSAAPSSNGLAPIVYSGPLAGLLDQAAARYGLFWEWQDHGVVFFKTKSRTFRLAALPGNTNLSTQLGTKGGESGGSSGDSAAGGSVKNENALQAGVAFTELSVWKGIEDSIKTMLSKEGVVMVTPATGTVTVEDTPPVLDRVAQFVQEQNEALSRQVVINVRVLSVTLNNSSQYGIDWNAVYAEAGADVGGALVKSFSADTSAASLTLRTLSGSLANSDVVLNALSKQGRVSQVTSASVVTINNQPTPIQVGKRTAYLAESTSTAGTVNSGASVSLKPGQVVTGFSMNVIPHILDNQKMMLQYSADLSTLQALKTVTSGGSSIQTPEVDTRNFLQRVVMNSGETLVVSGFEQTNASGSEEGVEEAKNIFLGGGFNTATDRTVLVILIQPVLTRSP